MGAEEEKTNQKKTPHFGRKEKSAFKSHPFRGMEGVSAGILYFFNVISSFMPTAITPSCFNLKGTA